jgi:hypothetical protein
MDAVEQFWISTHSTERAPSLAKPILKDVLCKLRANLSDTAKKDFGTEHCKRCGTCFYSERCKAVYKEMRLKVGKSRFCREKLTYDLKRFAVLWSNDDACRATPKCIERFACERPTSPSKRAADSISNRKKRQDGRRMENENKV